MTTPQDHEHLSAYLDQQLTSAEKKALEARLAQDPTLQAELQSLQRTVQAFRRLPKVKPPRNFTLKPAQAGVVKRQAFTFTFLRLATALSAVLFVFVLLGDFATAPTTNFSAVTESGGGAAAPTEIASANDAALQDEAPAPTANVESITSFAVTETATGAGGDTAPPSETATSGVGIVLAPEAATPTPDGSRSAATPETDDGDDEFETTIMADTVTPEVPPIVTQPPPINSLRLLEIGLATLTLLFALAAWAARR